MLTDIMESEPIVQAIAEARREMARIEIEIARLTPLQQRLSILQHFLETAAAVLSLNESSEEQRNAMTSVGDVVKEARRIVDAQGDRLWKAIHIVMAMNGKPMTSDEVLSALAKQGISVQGDHKRETVRSAMIRKDDTFERVGRGIFALKAWPLETKSAGAEMASSDQDEEEGW
jgi:hypothetical protein